jgi:hypothetical protein
VFIVWGKKYVYRHAGHVADFCNICRTPQAFNLQRIGLADHLYYVTVGEGKLAGHQRTCGQCQSIYSADPGRYANVSKRKLPLAQLQQHTFPDLTTRFGDWLELEERGRKTPLLLNDDERAALIEGPFAVMAEKTDRFYASKKVDKEVWIAIAATALFCTIIATALNSLAPENQGSGVVIALVLGLIGIVWQMALADRRFLRREVLPLLSASLSTLQPRQDEIQAVLDKLRRFKRKLGENLTATQVLEHIRHGKQ